jgi:hypothetical protein
VKTVRIIFINVITFVVLLALVNLGCGWYLKRITPNADRDKLPNYQADPERARKVFRDYFSVKHDYEPFVEWKSKRISTETTTISESGERMHKAPSSKQAEKKIARFFGGSTMWGEGSDDAHTIPALFNDLQPDYEVHNHGQLAYNTRQELDALISLYSQGGRAELVIFYDGVNDAAFLCPTEITDLPGHRMVPMYRQKLYSGRTAAAKDLVAAIFYENILQVIRGQKQRDTADAYDCTSNPEKAEHIAEMVMKNWEMAHEIVTNRGGKFMAILQPAAYIGNPRTDHLKLDQDLGKNFHAIYALLKKKIAERKHSWVYDLSDRFDGNDYIFIDFCHVSPNGNEIIAKDIARLVNENNIPPNDGQISFLHP